MFSDKNQMNPLRKHWCDRRVLNVDDLFSFKVYIEIRYS
jgi:hypothetical protein